MSTFVDNRIVFELSGAREMVNESRAVELINQVTIDDLACTAIKLCNKSFSPEAATALIARISQFPNIVYADISDIIAGRPEEEALRTLSVFCDGLMTYKLKEVNLSDNALGKKGILACSGVLVGKSIQKLYLCNNGLSAEACATVADILLDGQCPPLEVLHFYNNMSGSAGASAISRVVQVANLLQDFRFSATRSGNEGCLDISKALGSLNTIQRLDLSDNAFGLEAGEVLATALLKQKSLSFLNLRDSGLSEKSAISIISALLENPTSITFLDLSGNSLAPNTAKILVSLIERATSLQELHLDDNDELGNEGVNILIPAISKSTSLKVLSVSFCDLTASSAYRLARAVSKLKSFHLLKIDGNQIAERGVEEIRGVIMRAGKLLGDLDENDEDGEDDLEDAIAEEEENAPEEAVDSGLVNAMAKVAL